MKNRNQLDKLSSKRYCVLSSKLMAVSSCALLCLGGMPKGFAATTVAAGTGVVSDTADSGTHHGQTSLVAGVGYSWVDGRSLGEVSATLGREINERTLLMAQLTAARGEGDLAVYSGGLGIRRAVGDGETIVGANGFFDYLQDESGFSYSQIGFGIEASRGRWFMDANGYIPVGETKRVDSVRETTTVTTEVRKAIPTKAIETRRAVTQITQQDREAMRSWDVELGYRLLQRRSVSMNVAAGFYQAWAGDTDVSGLKVRAELQFGRHLALGAEWRQNGGDIGQEWRADAQLRFDLYDNDSASTYRADMMAYDPVSARAAGTPLPASGKSVSNVLPARSGKEALNVVTSSGKNAKQVVAPLMPVPEATLSQQTSSLFGPIQRTPWPMTTLQSSMSTSVHSSSRILDRRPPPTVAPGCACGPKLIFD